jgi:hypothetical protein
MLQLGTCWIEVMLLLASAKFAPAATAQCAASIGGHTMVWVHAVVLRLYWLNPQHGVVNMVAWSRCEHAIWILA